MSGEQCKTEARKMAVYAAMIDRMDQNIGKVLTKLETLGKLDNTLIIFASDNGCSAEVPTPKNSRGEIGSMSCWSSLGRNWANASNTPYRYYKNDSYEGGICTPLITYWPKGIENGGRITDYNGHFIDIMATVIDITRAKYPRELRGDSIVPYQGESLVPLFNETERPRKNPLFWQWRDGKAIMKDNWKLVSKQKDGKDNWELFNMEKDKTETTDLSAKHPEVVAELKTLHEEWLANCAREQK